MAGKSWGAQVHQAYGATDLHEPVARALALTSLHRPGGAVVHSPSVNSATLLLSALISACTSGVVALGIEWLAKPRLEARKERLLARNRALAEIRRQLGRILELSIRLSKYPRMSGLDSERQAEMRRPYNEYIERARTSINALDEAISDLSPELPRGFYSLFTGYLGHAMGTLGSENTYKRKGEMLSYGTFAVRLAYETPRWRPLRRRKRIRLAESAIRNPPPEGTFE